MTINDYVSKMNGVRRKKPCSIEQIVEAEKQLKLQLSQEYKDLLLEGAFVGPYFEVGSIDGPEGVVELTKRVRSIYKNLPKDLYAVIDGGIDGLYILQNKDGKIYEVDDSDIIIYSYGSLLDYLKSYD